MLHLRMRLSCAALRMTGCNSCGSCWYRRCAVLDSAAVQLEVASWSARPHILRGWVMLERRRPHRHCVPPTAPLHGLPEMAGASHNCSGVSCDGQPEVMCSH